MTKNYGLIKERLDFIEEIIGGKNIDSIIDFNNNVSYDIPNNIEDIRELLNKKYIDFASAINDLGGKMLYIKSGSTGHTFKGVYPPPNHENKKSYAVKVVAYPKKEDYGDMYNIRRPENVELLMIKLLSQFVINKVNPHIVLPITTFNCSIKPFLCLTKNNIVNNKKIDQFIEKHNNNEYYNNVSVLVSEWADGGDLLDYIRKNYKSFKLKHWRVIFFQILSVLATIHSKYPEFRHNDLKANNILVQLIEEKSIKYKYIIDDQKYIIPNIGIQIKLWDFDFACIDGLIENAKVNSKWTEKINISKTKNRYYDTHYFFNTFTRDGFFPKFWTEKEIPDKVKDFVKSIIPEKYTSGTKYVTERGRILTNEEYTTPNEILKTHSFFKIMRKQ
jgi:serine/threonine protein kinase